MSKEFLGRKNLGPKDFFGPTILLLKNFLGQIMFGPKKNNWTKMILGKKQFSPKKLSEHNFESKEILD